MRAPFSISAAVYSPAIGSMSLPCNAVADPAWRRIVAMFCSMKFGCPSSTISTARLPSQKRRTSLSITGYATFITYSGMRVLPYTSATPRRSSARSSVL